MQLRMKVFLLAVFPLLLAVAAIAAVVQLEAQALAEAEMAAVQPVLVASQREQLQHYVNLALGAVEHLHSRGDDEAARSEALSILRRMDFGEDNYFFVYDLSGRSLMHPRQPELVGQNLWNLRDPDGELVIQKLIDAARRGGDYVEFKWVRPSTGKVVRKLGYVGIEPKWNWVIGTGLYLDELDEAKGRIDREASRAISTTMGIIVVIAGVAALIVAVCGLALNFSEQRVADAKMRALAHQVVLSQERERARVASELHDGVSQLLVAVKFIFESAQARVAMLGSEAGQTIDKTMEQGLERINEVLREVRRISHGLRPTALDDLGLVAALSQMLEEFELRSHLQVRLKAEDNPSMPEAVATALFRVVQEALNNIERHSGATEVTVTLMNRQQALRLSITDNGMGFDPTDILEQPRSGLGLSSMRERIETLGGLLTIRSGTGGTSIEIVLPANALKA
ncbi:cache domain-containing protein [Uliginosibacterium gangwonense]|uniref:cache domain-containing protein n=1 Tax=Uliginosibacterium gangwonense TaxID=392736 RepID=UPI00036CEBA5|nr:cache domain-containing protein [Uliginosibacterium gangwonense]